MSIDDNKLFFSSISEIYGFQFNHNGCANEANGGLAQDADFSIKVNDKTVLGISFEGKSIPAGNGVLIILEIDGDAGDICLTDVILSNEAASPIENNVVDCTSIVQSIHGCTDETACNYNEDANLNDFSCLFYDCSGECIVDEDCAGICGGSAVVDCANECGGSDVVD